jgi:N-acylneuraminate cytidylyltransferase
MIAWSIRLAKQSSCFSKVIVSTEDPEIAEIANEFDAETPFMRPQSLADDYINTLDVMRHAVDWAEAEYGEALSNVCCIYPAAPLIMPTDITNSLQILQKQDCSFVFSAKEYPSPIQRAFKISKKNRVEMFTPSEFYARSQDLERAYHDAGQFYWG